MSALKYLLSKEWGMGNGQCPECFGVPEEGHGRHPAHYSAEFIGHDLDCMLAKSIKELGGHPLFQGGYKSDVIYESYWTDSGLLSTRERKNNL